MLRLRMLEFGGTVKSSISAPTYPVNGGATQAPKVGRVILGHIPRKGSNADLNPDVWPLVCAII